MSVKLSVAERRILEVYPLLNQVKETYDYKICEMAEEFGVKAPTMGKWVNGVHGPKNKQLHERIVKHARYLLGGTVSQEVVTKSRENCPVHHKPNNSLARTHEIMGVPPVVKPEPLNLYTEPQKPYLNPTLVVVYGGALALGLSLILAGSLLL